VHRKIALILTAVLLPGGLLVLAAGYLVRTLVRTTRGRRVVDLARSRVPAWASSWRLPMWGAREAA